MNKEYLERKRKIALKELKPLADYFNIKLDYIIEDDGRESLVLNGQKIGATGNSLMADIDEVVIYIFIGTVMKNRYVYGAPKLENDLTKYWQKDGKKIRYIHINHDCEEGF